MCDPLRTRPLKWEDELGLAKAQVSGRISSGAESSEFLSVELPVLILKHFKTKQNKTTNVFHTSVRGWIAPCPGSPFVYFNFENRVIRATKQDPGNNI